GLLEYALGVLLRQRRKLGKGKVFFQDDASLLIGVYFQRHPLLDLQCLSDLFGNHNSAQIVYSSDDTCRFHKNIPPYYILTFILQGVGKCSICKKGRFIPRRLSYCSLDGL